MAGVRIVLLCIVAAVLYGIAHDLVTARVCVEYFTIAHPRLIESDDPTQLALFWGTVATWWVGLLIGVPLAWAARSGELRRRTAASLARPIARLLAIMAAAALAAGLIGGWLAARGAIALVEPFASKIPAAHHVAFIAVAAAHVTSYAAGALGGLVLIVSVWRSRTRGGRRPGPAPRADAAS